MKPETVACFGELMLRLDCPTGSRIPFGHQFNRYYGGSEANAAVVMAQLGAAARFISAVPDNPIGRDAAAALKAIGVDTRYISFTANRMGIYFTENGGSLRPTRVVYDRKGSAFSQLQAGTIDWKTVLEGCTGFHWSGITPALGQNSIDLLREGLEVARQSGLRISADLNYRSQLWDFGVAPHSVMPELLSYCQVINGDLTAAEKFLGISFEKDKNPAAQFDAYCQALGSLLPAATLLSMSFRQTSAFGTDAYQAFLHHNGQTFASREYWLPAITDRIGSGDAFMGGLLAGLGQLPDQSQTLLNRATACAVLKHSLQGDFALIEQSEIDNLITNGPANRVNR